MKKQKTKKYNLSNRRQALQVIDFLLKDKNRPKLSRSKVQRLADIKVILEHNTKKDGYAGALKQLHKVFGINAKGELTSAKKYNRKIRITLRKNKDEGWYVRIAKPSSKGFSSSVFQRGTLTLLMYEFDDVLMQMNLFNLDNYFSDFASEFYPDWIERFAKAIECENISNTMVVNWMTKLRNDWAPLWDGYGKEQCRAAIYKMTDNKFKKPETFLEETVIRLLKGN